MRVIDLRSDTVTQPTDAMRRAMAEAEVGDDVYGEDPTINRLEARAAALMGKEAALFVASGTMSNLVAVLTHTRRGDEVIMGDRAHIYENEVGGGALIGGLVYRELPNDDQGRIDPDAVDHAIRGENIHYPHTGLVCLENTHNRCAGAVLTPSYTGQVAKVAHARGVPVHLDGARVLNAAVALEVPVTELTRDVDSVSFCLSKGLSAPVGSLLCGSRDYIARARKYRKLVGGGMRQAGHLAAAGLVALDTGITRLAEDHANAARLAKGLARVPGLAVVHPESVQTNIVIFEVERPDPRDLVARLKQRGVLANAIGGRRVRVVTHRNVSQADIDEALNIIAGVMKEAVVRA